MTEMLMEREATTLSPESLDRAPHAEVAAPARLEGLAADLVKLFKLLSDETRLRILLALAQEDELHVRALCDLLNQSQPAVSHHLALLRVAGLIDRRREGKHNFYHLASSRIEQLLDQAF